MIINNNTMAQNSHRMMGLNASTMGKSTEKLSSGLRVNRAADDAAGLSISEKMRGQIRGLTQASRNSADAISVVQTAEGALDEAHSILQRMRQLAVQSSNDSNVQADRDALQEEVTALTNELDRIADTTEFNTQKLLDGSFQNRVFHVGANEGQNLSVSVEKMSAEGLGVKETAQTITPKKEALDTSIAAKNSSIADKKTSLTTKTTSMEMVKASLSVKSASLDSTTAGKKASLATANSKIASIKGGQASVRKTKVDDVIATSGSLGKMVASLDTINKLQETNAGDDKKLASLGKAEAAKLTSIAGVNKSVAANLKKIATMGKGGASIKANQSAKVEASINNVASLKGSVTKGVAEADGEITKMNKQLTDLTKDVTALEDRKKALDNTVANGGQISVKTQKDADAAIKTINDALTKVSTQRSKLGAIQNRMEHTIKNLDNAAENLQAAESRVRDVDMAKEMSEFTKKNILTQASQAMLAQANQLPQQVLQLLR